MNTLTGGGDEPVRHRQTGVVAWRSHTAEWKMHPRFPTRHQSVENKDGRVGEGGMTDGWWKLEGGVWHAEDFTLKERPGWRTELRGGYKHAGAVGRDGGGAPRMGRGNIYLQVNISLYMFVYLAGGWIILIIRCTMDKYCSTPV